MGGKPGKNIRVAERDMIQKKVDANQGINAIKARCRDFGCRLAIALHEEGILETISQEEIIEKIAADIAPLFRNSFFSSDEYKESFIQVAVESFEREKNRRLNRVNIGGKTRS